MDKHWILTVLSEDKPGVVKQLAEIISRNGGNWLESQLSQLAGRFAGVVHFTTNTADIATLEADFSALRASGIHVQIERLDSIQPVQTGPKLRFSAVGPDRPGIVLEITHALAGHNINLEKLSTTCSSMPYSGEPLFEAEGLIAMNEITPLAKLQEQLDAISDSLGIDVSINE